MITSLSTAIEQIKKKGTKIAEMDERISTLIADAMELESNMYDAEQFQNDIIDQITRANRYMELCTPKPHRRPLTPPHVNSQLDSQQLLLEDVNSSVVESVTESTLSVVGSISTSIEQTVSVSTIMTPSNNALPATTSNTAIISQTNTSHFTETCGADNTMSSLPINTMIYSTSLGSHPLIPAVSQNMSSLISPQRPITSTLFVPHSLNRTQS